MNRFSTQQNGMTNSFFFGVYRVLEKSSSFVNIKCKNLTDKQKCLCEFVFRYFTINRENENKLYCQVCLHIQGICYSDRNMNAGYTFTFMHLADAFIQSDLK